MEIAFWMSFAGLFYTFIGYPLALRILASLSGKRPEPNGFVPDSALPAVTIVLSVFNEEAVIADKLENFKALDYPPDRLEMVIVSDQCTDRTEEMIRAFACDRIRLVVRPERSGKSLNLNAGAEAARGAIILFTDANSMFAPDAVKRLTAPFQDPDVGLVSGRSIYLDARNQPEEMGGTYRKYEEMIKAAESRVTSIVGADGAIYAMRKDLYIPLRREYINDLYHTGQVVWRGYRAVSAPRAVCREKVDGAHAEEFNRQTRIMAQSWLIYFAQIGRLLRHGRLAYAWAMTSHKLLRWLTLPLMALMIIANLWLSPTGGFYVILLIVQLCFWGVALVGGEGKNGLARFPYFFCLIHLAAMTGLIRYGMGDIYTTWDPRNS